MHDLDHATEALVRCSACNAYTSASNRHQCTGWRLPPGCDDLNPARLTKPQLRGTACVRCGRSLTGPGVYGRPASPAIGPDGRTASYAIDPAGRPHYLAVHRDGCPTT